VTEAPQRIKGRRKPAGWRGEWGDIFWTKDSVYSVKYRCQTCGCENRGTRGDHSPNMHKPGCAVLPVRLPPKDGLGMEIDDDSVYYLQDTRQKVGNCMLFWCPKDAGYTCQLDDAGRYTGAEARDRCRDGTHKAWPCGFIERNAVRHVRADSIDVRLAEIEKVRGPNGDAT
jgi:hypothetical protein